MVVLLPDMVDEPFLEVLPFVVLVELILPVPAEVVRAVSEDWDVLEFLAFISVPDMREPDTPELTRVPTVVLAVACL